MCASEREKLEQIVCSLAKTVCSRSYRSFGFSFTCMYLIARRPSKVGQRALGLGLGAAGWGKAGIVGHWEYVIRVGPHMALVCVLELPALQKAAPRTAIRLQLVSVPNPKSMLTRLPVALSRLPRHCTAPLACPLARGANSIRGRTPVRVEAMSTAVHLNVQGPDAAKLIELASCAGACNK